MTYRRRMVWRQVRVWALPLLAAAGFAALLAVWHGRDLGFPGELPAIVRAELVETRSAERPPLEGPWQEVALPHAWRRSSEDPGHAWIRIRVPPAAVGETRALYLPRSNPILEAFLDETPWPEARQPGSTLDLVFLRPPRLLSLPRVADEGAWLVLRLESPTWSGYMGPAWIASRARLEPAYELRRLLGLGLSRFVFAGLLGFTLFMLATWLARPKDPLPGWLALSFGAVTISGWSMLTVGLPLPPLPTAYVGTGVLLALIAKTTHAIVGVVRPRIERAFWAWAALSVVTRLALPDGAVSEFFRIFMTAAALPLSLYPLWVMLHANATRPNPELRVLAAAGLVYEIASLHDLGWFAGVVPASHPPAIHVGLGVMVVSFGWVYVRRFIAAIDEADALNRTLDRRVREKERELDANYRRLAVLERERAIDDERTRMMEELHDGMGGHISSALAQLRADDSPERTSLHLRRAMQDMRLLVHSLDRATGDLATLLGLLRDQLEPMLEAAGIALRWRVRDTPAPEGYGPEQALHVTRIVQQAVANAAEHSKARSLELRTEAVVARDGSFVSVVIEDDGRGLEATGGDGAPGRQHGLRNMQRRADRIGASLEITARECGTRVELRLPLAP